MKPILFFLSILISVSTFGQNEHRKLLAHYPLTEHIQDITGQQDSLDIANVTIDDQGLYFDGPDRTSDTSSKALISIGELDIIDYYFSVDLNIDSLSGQAKTQPIRTLFEMQTGNQWMNIFASDDFRNIQIGRSGGGTVVPVGYQTNEWFTLALSYAQHTKTRNFYINDELVLSDTFSLETENNDLTFGLGVLSSGFWWPMKGHWRNLMIYGPDTTNLPLDIICSEDNQPYSEESMDGRIHLEISGGQSPYIVTWNEQDTIFNDPGQYIIPNLTAGIYTINITDSLGNQLTCETTLESSGQLPLIAHYPLQGDGQDLLMVNPDIQFTNVDLLDSAIYIDGANSFSDTANQVFINRINQLNHDNFEFRLDFKLDSITDPTVSQSRSIFVAGSSYRWVALLYNNQTKKIQLSRNSFQPSPRTIDFEFDRWYEMSISYSYSTKMLKLSMDGELVDSIRTVLNTNLDRSITVDCICGRQPMKGYWRNLRIYSLGQSQIHPFRATTYISAWNSTKDTDDGSISIDVQGGRPTYSVQLLQNDSILLEETIFGLHHELDDLPIGEYQLIIKDIMDTMRFQTIELLPPQTELPILSYYPMRFDLNDTSGIHEPLSLAQTEFIFNQGIAIPGNENDTSGIDQVSTNLSELNTDDFYISMNVTIDSIDGLNGGDKRSIFIGGLLFRWMYPHYFQSTKTIGLTYNNSNTASGDYAFEYGREYEIAIAYSREQQIGTWFINRQEMGRDTFDMITGDDLSLGLNCFCGPDPMKGLWRNLKVYSVPQDTSSTTSRPELLLSDPMFIYPNPGSSQVTIEMGKGATASILSFINSLGEIIKTIRVDSETQLVLEDISDLAPGVYWIRGDNKIQKFIKQ